MNTCSDNFARSDSEPFRALAFLSCLKLTTVANIYIYILKKKKRKKRVTDMVLISMRSAYIKLSDSQTITPNCEVGFSDATVQIQSRREKAVEPLNKSVWGRGHM